MDRWICFNMYLKEECSLQFDFLEGHFVQFFIACSEGYFWVSSGQTKALWVYFPMPRNSLNLKAYSWLGAIPKSLGECRCCVIVVPCFQVIPMQSHFLVHLAPEEQTYRSQGLMPWGWCLFVVSQLAKGVYKGGFSYLYHPFAIYLYVCIRPTSLPCFNQVAFHFSLPQNIEDNVGFKCGGEVGPN